MATASSFPPFWPLIIAYLLWALVFGKLISARQDVNVTWMYYRYRTRARWKAITMDQEQSPLQILRRVGY